jgi:two-component system KDP operon response regulator KdpE
LADAPLILVIEDEPQMRRFLRNALGTHEYRLVEADTMREGLAQVAGRSPDVILLDLGLPDGDGLDATRQIREWSPTPIIVLSARGLERDKVAALDAGADDYLTKPFSVGELLARIRVALRHAATGGVAPAVFEARELRVDVARRVVTVQGAEVHLTPTEYRILAALVKHAGRVLMHRQLIGEVWGNHAAVQTQALRVYVNQLRHKIEREPARPRLLITEPGVGYRLRDE